MYLDGINKNVVFFHYHLNCRDFTDNEGVIKCGLMQTNQNTVYARFYFKSQQVDVNIWIESIKTSYFVSIISIVGILLTMQLLLNLVECKQIKILFMLVFTSNLNNLMSTDVM